jgi:hypothetical protein
MRRAALAILALALLAGCGGEKKSPRSTTTATTQPAKTTPKKPAEPQYKPSARHKHRPPGSIYNDEIGENVVSAPYDRIIQVFGPPASRHGKCIRYRIVGQPHRNWEFCFKGQRMTGAGVVPAP